MKSGVEYLAQHPGWKTRKRKRKPPKLPPKLLFDLPAAWIPHLSLTDAELDILDAVILTDRWSYRDDDEDSEFPKRIHIYAVSGAGSILFETEKGEKEKDSSGVTLRQFDATKLARFKELTATVRKAKEELEKLLEGWPELDSRELRGAEETEKEAD